MEFKKIVKIVQNVQLQDKIDDVVSQIKLWIVLKVILTNKNVPHWYASVLLVIMEMFYTSQMIYCGGNKDRVMEFNASDIYV